MGFGVWGLGFGVSDFGFRISGSGFQVSGFGVHHWNFAPFLNLTSTASPLATGNLLPPARKVDVRLLGKGNSNSHGARPVHLIITMIKWIRTSRLSIKNSLSYLEEGLEVVLLDRVECLPLHQHHLQKLTRPALSTCGVASSVAVCVHVYASSVAVCVHVYTCVYTYTLARAYALV